MRRLAQRFVRDEEGVVLVEAMIALPILFLMTVGILEFGNMMWERQQLQAGVRDAARYLSRCRDASTEYAANCSLEIARNLAFTGNATGEGYLRVPGWDEDSELTFDPALADLPGTPDRSSTVVIEGTVTYRGSPLFDFIFDDSIEISYWTQMRYYGW